MQPPIRFLSSLFFLLRLVQVFRSQLSPKFSRRQLGSLVCPPDIDATGRLFRLSSKPVRLPISFVLQGLAPLKKPCSFAPTFLGPFNKLPPLPQQLWLPISHSFDCLGLTRFFHHFHPFPRENLAATPARFKLAPPLSARLDTSKTFWLSRIFTLVRRILWLVI